MVNVTFSVPEKAHKVMKAYPEIRWTELARKPILELVERLEESPKSDIVEILKKERMKETSFLLKKSKGDSRKALELWAKERQKRLKRAERPKWWKNATSTL